MVTPTGIEPLTPNTALPYDGEGVKDGEGWEPHRMILLSPRSG
jgi:hypothetical protein